MVLSIEHREMLRRWMPAIIVALVAWLLIRGIRRTFWTVFGLAWGFFWMSKWMPFWR
jgi:hypothetical protein